MNIRLMMALCLVFGAAPALADQLELTGVVRDFKRGDRSGGHPDFETAHTVVGHGDYGHVTGLVTMSLSPDGKPVYNPIRPTNDTIASAASLAQWFRDDAEINASKAHTVVLDNGSTTPGGVYTFQTTAFFPVDKQLFGNQGLTHNYHFTYELHTRFTYQPGQYFRFRGDDDVWVYVNGVKVIDLGGVHEVVAGSLILFDGKAFVEKNHFATVSPVTLISSDLAAQLEAKWQAAGLGAVPTLLASGGKYIDLGLTDRQNCTLDFFFAERHTTQSNFRIDTSMQLEDVPIVTVSPAYD